MGKNVGRMLGCNGEVCMAESANKTQAHSSNTPNHPNMFWWTPLEYTLDSEVQSECTMPTAATDVTTHYWMGGGWWGLW